MPHRILFSLLFVLTCLQPVSADDDEEREYRFNRSLLIKATPWSLFDPYKKGVLMLGAEYVFAEVMGFSAEVGIPVYQADKRFDMDINQDIKYRGMLKFYVNNDKPRRSFIAVNAFYRRIDFSGDDVRVKTSEAAWQYKNMKAVRQTTGLGLFGGTVFPIAGHFFCEWYAGLSAVKLDVDVSYESRAFLNNRINIFSGAGIGYIEDAIGVYPTYAVKIGLLVEGRGR